MHITKQNKQSNGKEENGMMTNTYMTQISTHSMKQKHNEDHITSKTDKNFIQDRTKTALTSIQYSKQNFLISIHLHIGLSKQNIQLQANSDIYTTC